MERATGTTKRETPSAAARAAGGASLALLGLWSVLFAYAVHGGMPFNPVRLPFETQLRSLMWIPEGWAFFTRDPREERLLTMRREATGRWVTAARGPNALASHAFGLSRRPRATGIETGLLIAEIPSPSWSDCKESVERCLERTAAVKVVRNPSPDPQLCGSLGFALQKPVPWAWSRSSRKITMPSRVARMEVTCE